MLLGKYNKYIGNQTASDFFWFYFSYTFNLPDFDPNNLSEATIKHYTDIILHIGNIQSIILRNYNLTAYLNMIIKFQVI